MRLDFIQSVLYTKIVYAVRVNHQVHQRGKAHTSPHEASPEYKIPGLG
jgi:hypothetical protein